MPRYAEVAVFSGSPQLGAFTYAAPEGMLLRRGMTVVVPWRTQWAVGLVLEITDTSEVADPRAIARVLDDQPLQPLLNQDQLDLAAWIGERYFAPIASCLGLFLPPGAPKRPRRADSFRALVPRRPTSPKRLILAITADALRERLERWPRSKRTRPGDLLAALASARGTLSLDDAMGVIGGAAQLRDWLAATTLAVLEGDQLRLTIASEEASAAADALRRTNAERQQMLILEALEDGPLDESAARRLSGASNADVDSLVRDGLILREDSDSSEALPAPVSAPELTDEQAAAVEAVCAALDGDGGAGFLLHGVTGSGKTEVYLAAVERALALGLGVIVLVPEIALAPQTIRRFEARFPGRVAVRHSQLKQREAREQWRQVQAGEKPILIGARSALFGLMPKLGLVIVDEEHEWTYKQDDPQPRYHAVSVALEMARRWGVVTLLGSATPDVVTMSRARSGELTLLELTQRLSSEASEPRPIPLPIVDVVDMREELAAGVRSVFSRELDAGVSEALQRGEQVLLFLNRRGMSALVCRACGEAVECGTCSIAMTLHRPGPILTCHDCGDRRAAPSVCPACGDERIGAMSFGTAQLEAEVHRRWGGIAVTRWDRDTVSAAGSHDALLQEFAQGRSQVLIGTQMIAKGLDLPGVTVAGIVNADLSLRESDYSAAERTFQLLAQVAGRAGRGTRGGRVIVQTYAPDHPAVLAAAAHDYEAFYQQELLQRAMLDLPPFGRLARLTVSRSTAGEADAEALRVASQLSDIRARTAGASAEVIGPAPARPALRRGQYRRQILLKGEEPSVLLRTLQLEHELGRGWSINVDPAGD